LKHVFRWFYFRFCIMSSFIPPATPVRLTFEVVWIDLRRLGRLFSPWLIGGAEEGVAWGRKDGWLEV
jgi:hypothetical protein